MFLLMLQSGAEEASLCRRLLQAAQFERQSLPYKRKQYMDSHIYATATTAGAAGQMARNGTAGVKLSKALLISSAELQELMVRPVQVKGRAWRMSLETLEHEEKLQRSLLSPENHFRPPPVLLLPSSQCTVINHEEDVRCLRLYPGDLLQNGAHSRGLYGRSELLHTLSLLLHCIVMCKHYSHLLLFIIAPKCEAEGKRFLLSWQGRLHVSAHGSLPSSRQRLSPSPSDKSK